MALICHLMVFLALLASGDLLDSGVFLQLDGCALANVVSGILSSEDLAKKMSDSSVTKKALGKKGNAPKGITNIKVEKIAFTNILLEFQPNKGFQMSVTNKIEIAGKSFLGGRTELKLELNIITNSTIKKQNVSCPSLKVSGCKVVVLNVKANLPKGQLNADPYVTTVVSGRRILPSVMDKFLDKNLKTLLPATACPTVDYILTEVNKKLCLQDTGLLVGKSGGLHYLLSPIPTVTAEHLEMEFNVTLFKGTEAVDPAENITDSYTLPSNPEVTSLVLTAGFLGYSFTLLQQEEVFNFNTTEEEIKDAGGVSTSVFSDFIPELPEELEDYKIFISVNKPPLVTLSSTKALLHLYSTMEVTASSPDSEPSALFVIDLHMNFKIEFSIKENNLHSVFSLDKTFLSLESSSVGDFEVEDMKEFISSVINVIYTPAINAITETDIPLPELMKSLDIDMSKAGIETDQDIVVLSINVCKA